MIFFEWFQSGVRKQLFIASLRVKVFLQSFGNEWFKFSYDHFKFPRMNVSALSYFNAADSSSHINIHACFKQPSNFQQTFASSKLTIETLEKGEIFGTAGSELKFFCYCVVIEKKTKDECHSLDNIFWGIPRCWGIPKATVSSTRTTSTRMTSLTLFWCLCC